jgi:pilus assembly protein Flp/PilA
MIRRFLKDEGGQDVVEYGLLLVIISLVAVGVFTYMGGSLSSIFSKMATKVRTTGDGIP